MNTIYESTSVRLRFLSLIGILLLFFKLFGTSQKSNKTAHFALEWAQPSPSHLPPVINQLEILLALKAENYRIITETGRHTARSRLFIFCEHELRKYKCTPSLFWCILLLVFKLFGTFWRVLPNILSSPDPGMTLGCYLISRQYLPATWWATQLLSGVCGSYK